MDAKLVRELRERTGAGIMECKKSLVESNGDMEKALEALKQGGLIRAQGKAGRETQHGAVGVYLSEDGKLGTIVELNSETDFVGKNQQFQTLLGKITKAFHEADDTEDFNQFIENGKIGEIPIKDLIAQNIAVIGENLSPKRGHRLNLSADGIIASYVHNASAPNIGKIGVLVSLESKQDQSELKELGKQIAMHIAASNPKVIDVAQITDAEKKSVLVHRENSGTPSEEDLKNFYEEMALLEQPFVLDAKTKVKEVLASKASSPANPIRIVDFVRFSLGEG